MTALYLSSSSAVPWNTNCVSLNRFDKNIDLNTCNRHSPSHSLLPAADHPGSCGSTRPVCPAAGWTPGTRGRRRCIYPRWGWKRVERRPPTQIRQCASPQSHRPEWAAGPGTGRQGERQQNILEPGFRLMLICLRPIACFWPADIYCYSTRIRCNSWDKEVISDVALSFKCEYFWMEWPPVLWLCYLVHPWNSAVHLQVKVKWSSEKEFYVLFIGRVLQASWREDKNKSWK